MGWTHRPTYLIFGKDTGDCTGLDRADQTVSTSNRERHTRSYQATPPTPTINSTHACRLDHGVFIFPRSSFCKVTQLPSRTNRSLVFLYRFSRLRSRTGLCARTKALLFFHHSFIFHPTTLHLPYLLQHVPRI